MDANLSGYEWQATPELGRLVSFYLQVAPSVLPGVDRHVKTGNLLTGRGSSIADASVKLHHSGLLKDSRITPVILLLFSSQPILSPKDSN